MMFLSTLYPEISEKQNDRQADLEQFSNGNISEHF
jgi:hypothetical protein